MNKIHVAHYMLIISKSRAREFHSYYGRTAGGRRMATKNPGEAGATWVVGGDH
jgi:hypothetical protein